MADTPLLATGRVRVVYRVAGVVHDLHLYCTPFEAAGVWSVQRNDFSGYIALQDAADAFGAAFLPMYRSTDVDSCVMHLEELISGTMYVERDQKVVNGTLASSGTTQKASQLTMTLRDISYKKAKIVALETIVAPPYKHISVADIPAPQLNFYKLFSVTSGTGSNRPALWVVSRGNNALMNEPLIAATGSLNRRIRRDRGLG